LNQYLGLTFKLVDDCGCCPAIWGKFRSTVPVDLIWSAWAEGEKHMKDIDAIVTANVKMERLRIIDTFLN